MLQYVVFAVALILLFRHGRENYFDDSASLPNLTRYTSLQAMTNDMFAKAKAFAYVKFNVMYSKQLEILSVEVVGFRNSYAFRGTVRNVSSNNAKKLLREIVKKTPYLKTYPYLLNYNGKPYAS